MPYSVNGFGTKFYGEADHHPDGSFIATKWITVAYLPVIPVGSFRLIRSGNPYQSDIGYAEFGVLEDLPIFWPQVFRIYTFLLCSGIWYAAIIWLFFVKNHIFDQFQTHLVQSNVVLVSFMVALAIPFVFVYARRRKSKCKVEVLNHDKKAATTLLGKLWQFIKAVFIVLAILPPVVVAALKLPPAAWLNAQQGRVFGGSYFPSATFILLYAAYFLGIFIVLFPLNILSKRLTGRKLFQLFSKQRVENCVIPLTNIFKHCGNIYADVYVPQALLNDGKTVSLSMPDGRLIQLKLDPAMSTEAQLCFKNQAQGGSGDVFLTLRISS